MGFKLKYNTRAKVNYFSRFENQKLNTRLFFMMITQITCIFAFLLDICKNCRRNGRGAYTQCFRALFNLYWRNNFWTHELHYFVRFHAAISYITIHIWLKIFLSTLVMLYDQVLGRPQSLYGWTGIHHVSFYVLH